MKLRWRIRLAGADATSLQRVAWSAAMARPENLRPAVVRYIEQLVASLNLGARVAAVEAGAKGNEAALMAEAEAGIARRRWDAIQQAAAGSVKLQERFIRVMGPAQGPT